MSDSRTMAAERAIRRSSLRNVTACTGALCLVLSAVSLSLGGEPSWRPTAGAPASPAGQSPAPGRLAQLPPQPPIPNGVPPEQIRPEVRPRLEPVLPPAPLFPPGPYPEERVRLPALAAPVTPRPSPEVLQRYGQFVDRTIDAENVLDVVVGRPRILVLRQVPFRIRIEDPAVADYQIITERELLITGLEVGTTVMHLWFTDPADPARQEVLSYLVRAVPDPEARERLERVYEALEEEINRNFPDSVVRLSLVGDKLLLRGQARDVEEATQILRVVGANAPGGPVHIPVDNIQVAAVPDEFGEYQPHGLQDFLLRDHLGPDGTAARVINMLRVPGDHQVMLKVTVAEVNRSALRAIGAEIRFGGDAATFFTLLPVGTVGGNLLLNRGDFELALNALRSLNLARSLAEPNLVTLNGQPARFQAGGQFPVPQITGFTGPGLQGVQFVPFGVQLTFVPFVTDKDRIRLTVAANVSTRDEAIGSTIAGADVAGLNTRNFFNTVELRHGQTLAVAGLIQNNYGATSARVPFLGDVPLLGRLFSADTASYDEQELVVLVTPFLVHPVSGESLPLPGSDLFEPDDVEFFLLGRLEGCRAEDYRSPVRTDIFKMKAFRRCQQEYIIGPSGHADGRW